MIVLTIGKRIAALRTGKKMTQKVLASAIGVSDRAVSKWERDVCSPDISILSKLAQTLGVSVDALLTGEITKEEQTRFLSLEKYLMGEFGFWVADLHTVSEEAVLLLDSPDKEDATHGRAMTGTQGEAIAQMLTADSRAYGWQTLHGDGCLGVVFVSNVPLLNLSPPIDRLAAELEYTRLGRHEINRYLFDRFAEKMTAIFENERIKIVAMTRDFNKKYLFTVLSQASPYLWSRVQKRIADGDLRLLFVGLPTCWIDNKTCHNWDIDDFIKLIK